MASHMVCHVKPGPVGSLSKLDVHGSENVIWKCRFAFLQSPFNYSKSLCLKKCALTILELNWNQRLRQDKIEHSSSYAHVVHITAKQVISRHRKNENVFKMSEDENYTCKVCKNTVCHCQICKFVGVLLPSSCSLVKRYAKNTLFLHTKCGNHSSFRSCNFRSTTTIRRSLRQRFLK